MLYTNVAIRLPVRKGGGANVCKKKKKIKARGYRAGKSYSFKGKMWLPNVNLKLFYVYKKIHLSLKSDSISSKLNDKQK